MIEAFSTFVKAHEAHPDILDLEPETLKDLLQVDSKKVAQIYACGNVVRNHSAFEDYHVFQKTVLEFNHRYVDFSYHQDIGIPEVEWAVCVMRMLDPIFPFSNEVLTYAAVLLHEEGFTSVPFFLAQQKSISGLDVKHFLDQLNHEHEPKEHSDKVQSHLLFQANNYVQTRYEQLTEELLGSDEQQS